MIEPKVIRFSSLDSTNTKLKELALNGATDGTVVIAETQTAGRGLGKRTWHSPKGGLYLSILLRPLNAKRAPELSILGGVALSQSVFALLPKSKDVSLKWPNDCLVGWKKIGGILCEVTEFGACIVGIGINVNMKESDLLPFMKNPFSATSFSLESQGAYDLKEVSDMVMKKILLLYELYQKEGFDPIRYLWERGCRIIGKKVSFKTSELSELDPQNATMTGTFIGLDDLGAMILAHDSGERRTFYSGMITGLIDPP